MMAYGREVLGKFFGIRGAVLRANFASTSRAAPVCRREEEKS